jgi:hypothetical protein
MSGLAAQFFQAYLVGFMIMFNVTTGGLAVLLLHLLVGGQWGLVSRKPLRALTAMFPWVTLLFIPVFLGAHYIYSWTDPAVAADLGRKAVWLKLPFFGLRAACYFAFFNAVAFKARKMIAADAPKQSVEYFQKVGGLCMFSLFVVASLAIFDWMMSLEPHWSSTLYGLMILMGGGLTAFCVIVVTLDRFQNPAHPIVVSEKASHDLGNLIFAFTIFWTYMAVSQYIIVWSGNLPEEIPWYIVRNSGGWRLVAWLDVLCQFVLPFLLLLSQRRKKNLDRLAKVAIYILCIRVLDLYWLIVPDFSPQQFRIDIFDVVVIGGLLAFWFTMYRRNFAKEVLA